MAPCEAMPRLDCRVWGYRPIFPADHAGRAFLRMMIARRRALGALAALITAAVYLFRLDRVVGMYVDDAWYVLFGKALAAGHGYTMVNAPMPGLLPPGPPGFPALLSLVFLIQPAFPGNVFWLKSVSIAAMFGVAIMSYRYFVQRHVHETLAMALAVATAITPAFVFFATSTVMSECVFTLAQLGTVWLVNRSTTTRSTIGAAICGALTVLTRTAGLALVLAVTLNLLATRRFRHALVFAMIAGLCVAPWFWYERAHTAPLVQRLQHGGAHVFTYGEQFWMRWAGDPTAGPVTIADVPVRVASNLVDVFGRDVGGIVLPTLYRGAAESGEEAIALGGYFAPASMGSAPGAMVISFLLSAIALAGFAAAVRQGPTAAEFLVPISLAVTVLFPMWCFRFVLPLTPFLFFYLVSGIRVLASTRFVPVARIALLVVIGLNLLDHAQYMFKLHTRRPTDWIADAEEITAVTDWMGHHLPPDARVATTNPPLVYLSTGRQTVASNDLRANWQGWQARHIDYVASLLPSQLPDPRLPYRVLYQSDHRRYWVIEFQ